LTGLGPVTVTAYQGGNTSYAPATPVAQTFTVVQETPILTFASIPSETYGNGPFAVRATDASSGAVTYSVTSGPATISGSTVTLTGAGTVVLGASQLASGNYTTATASISFTVAAVVSITPITPANRTMAPGTQTFSATASGGPTNNLTWSATGGTITSGGVWTAPDTAGTYTITATSVDNSATNVTTTVIITLPVITTQPVSKNVCAGYSQSFSLAASYAASYQWMMGTSDVGTNSSTLSFSPASSSNNGSYTCSVTNGAGSVVSNAVTLNVITPTTLAITSQPVSVTVYATQTATFAVSATGTGTLTYQWYTGTPGSGTIIPGATSATYTTGALAAGNSGTTYYVKVTDPNCTDTTLTSSAATLTVNSADTSVPPSITIQPTGEIASVGGTATFSVTASGPGTPPNNLTYQWYRVPYETTAYIAANGPTAGIAIATNGTSSTYTVPSTETALTNDGDNYYVMVQNAYGGAISVNAPLAVGNGILLQITGQPQTDYVATGSLASFSVTTACTGCITAYQWYGAAPGSSTFNPMTNGAVSSGPLSGATLSGATTSSLTINDVPATATGAVFYVLVTSTSDGVTIIPGTNPITSSNVALFAGTLGAVGSLCSTQWVLNGTTNGTQSAGYVSGDVPYQNTTACTIELTNDIGGEQAAIYWNTLFSTAKFTVTFTVTMSSSQSQPADGYALILADPSMGATTASIGRTGEGLGAAGIPGFVMGFDTFQNGNDNGGPLENTCPQYAGDTTNMACDPITVPYIAVGQGAPNLWENPWTYVNGNLNTADNTDYTDFGFANSSHTYVVTVVAGTITVTMDGNELLTGPVVMPPVAYLGFTASTGGSSEAVTISNLSATSSAP
jgi:hypothetical protein